MSSKKNFYETPQAEIIGLDAPCSLMQSSIEVPESGAVIPDVDIIIVDWNLL